MNKTIKIIIVLLFFVLSSSAQNKVVINGDTLVTITPENLKTINKIIVDLEYSKKIQTRQQNIIKQDSVLLGVKDSLILQYNIREKKKEEYYISQASKLIEDNNKLRKKARVKSTWLGTIGLVLGLLVGLIVK
jgi:hypothetical protein